MFVILGPNKECGHEYKEDDLKTAELIKNETEIVLAVLLQFIGFQVAIRCGALNVI